jgi:hypothetical protein
MSLIDLIQEEGYAGATLALADAIEAQSDWEEDKNTAEQMKRFAQKLRELAK